MRRYLRTRVSLSGGIPRVCTLGWYARPLQGILTATRGRRGASGSVGVGAGESGLWTAEGDGLLPGLAPSGVVVMGELQ